MRDLKNSFETFSDFVDRFERGPIAVYDRDIYNWKIRIDVSI